MDLRTWKISSLILATLFFISLIFLILFGLQIASNNKDKAAEIKNALGNQKEELSSEFQKEREATEVTYVADEIFGSFEFSYPGVWQTNVAQGEGKTEELNFLADPKVIVVKESERVIAGLRVIVYKDKYATQVKAFEDKNKYSEATKLSNEDVTVSEVKGKKFTGKTEQSNGKNVQFILLPLRDKTLYIGTDDIDVFSEQFNKITSSLKISK